MVKITLDVLRKRYLELKDERDSILVIDDPLLVQREEILSQLQPLELQLRELDAQRREVRAPLSDIDNEMGRIARMLPQDRSVPAVEAEAAVE